MEKYNTLEQALTDLGWFHIDNIQTNNADAIKHLQSIFDPNDIDKDGQPKIKTEKTTIIICDNHDFNETYLIDMVSSILKENGYKPGDFELVLIDNITCRCYIQNPKFIPYITESDFKTIEKTKLKPCIIVVNSKNNAIVMVSEDNISTITEDKAKYILQYADDEMCKKLMHIKS